MGCKAARYMKIKDILNSHKFGRLQMFVKSSSYFSEVLWKIKYCGIKCFLVAFARN